jgi:hypothetical protein
MRTATLSSAIVVIAGFLWAPGVNAADPGPVGANDGVTVLYRGKLHTLTGKQAEVIRDAALDLLESSCEEIGGVDKDAEEQQRYEKAKKRSHILITFARPVKIPRAGNNKVPVRVDSLLVPFSPELNPETVYVKPGKPFRPFTRLSPDMYDQIRESLVKARIYPRDND